MNYSELPPKQLKGSSQKVFFHLKHHSHHASVLWDVSGFLRSLVPSISGKVSIHHHASKPKAPAPHATSFAAQWLFCGWDLGRASAMDQTTQLCLCPAEQCQ